jgi:hypothetical protein
MRIPEISSNTTLLFGSGVSIWSPCNIPMGSYISSSLLSFILGEETINKLLEDDLYHFLIWIPFETINEYAPQSIDLDGFYSNIFISTKYNELHDQLVKIALENSITALVTTNYDNAIELVPGSERNLKVICDHGFSKVDGIPYFKIHGSVTNSSSLVYKLSQEAVLDKWKEIYLHRLLDNRDLIVIGYSGIDFEICPVIASSNVSIVYWGYKPGTPENVYKTSGYRIIEKSHHVIPFSIDLQNGLPWFIQNTKLDLSLQNDYIASYLKISDEERMLWRFQLTSSIGYCKLAIDTVWLYMTTNYDNKCITKKDLGVPYFESGQFRDSARCFVLKALDYLRMNDSEGYFCSILGAYDSYRAGGYIIKASIILMINYLLLFFVRSPRIRTQTNIKVVSMIKSVKVALQFIFNYQKLKPIKRIILSMPLNLINSIAIMILDATKKAALESKCMFDIKHVDALYSLFESGQETTLSDVTSYRSLGYLSASTALFRKNMLTDNASQTVINEAIGRYKLMSLMENHQEAWKVAARLKTLTNGLESVDWDKHAEYHLNKCQYSSLYRKFMPIWISRGAKVNEGV